MGNKKNNKYHPGGISGKKDLIFYDLFAYCWTVSLSKRIPLVRTLP